MPKYNARQMTGTEYGGVEETVSTVQPKPPEAITPGEQLRLFYLTGEPDDAESIEDRRQFWGLRPADGRRPQWLIETGQLSEAEIELRELFG
jgi:hypothetical protein